jgi:glycosyltransferase involved in cell wall biosynthesis
VTDLPLVSVIIPFFNGARFLRESVASVRSQSYPRWELLLVDDGSTDGSSAMAAEMAAGDLARIRVLEHPGHRNRGVPATRNLGLLHARGEYVAFLDVDDVWFPSKLDRQVTLMERHPEAQIGFGRPLYWRSWNTEAGDNEPDTMPPLAIPPHQVVEPPKMLEIAYPLGSGDAPCPSDIIARRLFVLRIGGFEEEFVGMYQLFEDQAFLAKAYVAGGVVACDECLTRYRIREDSCVTSTRRSGKAIRARRYYLNWLRKYLKRMGVTDGEIQARLEGSLSRYRAGPIGRLRDRWHLVHGRMVSTGSRNGSAELRRMAESEACSRP